MIFISWSSGGTTSGYLSPLLIILPLLLQSGLLSAPEAWLSWIFGAAPGASTGRPGRRGQQAAGLDVWPLLVFGAAAVFTFLFAQQADAGLAKVVLHTGVRYPGIAGVSVSESEQSRLCSSLRPDKAGKAWQGVLFLLRLVLCLYLVICTAVGDGQGRRHGWWATIERLFFRGFHFGGRGQQAPHQRQQRRGQRRPAPRSHQARFANVVACLQKMPVEQYISAEALRKLPGHQLKAEMRNQGITVRDGESIDREDAVQRLLQLRNSSGCTCSVCCEDYEEGDVLRILRCKHRFHVECIDRWFLGSADRSEAPACPMCNAALQADEPTRS